MQLNIIKYGHGQPIVLLHGWGFNHKVWQHLLPNLGQHAELWLVDLPGHGDSDMANYDWPTFLYEFTTFLPDEAIWLGWSLGGLIAMGVARWQPQRVKSLLLVATSPCFVKRDNWHTAISTTVLQQFERNLTSDFTTTLQRFIALQVLNTPNARYNMRLLQNIVAATKPPQALQAGLEFLLATDLRSELKHITVPSLICLGTHDALVPVEIADFYKQNLPNSKLAIIQSAAHIPFLSHSEQFTQLVTALHSQTNHQLWLNL